MFNGVLTFKDKVHTMRGIQDRYRLNYLRKQKKQSDHFKELLEQAIIAYKAERRKIQER